MEAYIEEAEELGFDVIEISSEFLAIDTEDLFAPTELVAEKGLAPDSRRTGSPAPAAPQARRDLGVEVQQDPRLAIEEGRRHLEAGADKLVVEGEGITENVPEWWTDVVYEIADRLGLENCVPEAPSPEMFEGYVENFGPDVDLFVDDSQVVELDCMRSGLWGKTSSWGRVAS